MFSFLTLIVEAPNSTPIVASKRENKIECKEPWSVLNLHIIKEK